MPSLKMLYLSCPPEQQISYNLFPEDSGKTLLLVARCATVGEGTTAGPEEILKFFMNSTG